MKTRSVLLALAFLLLFSSPVLPNTDSWLRGTWEGNGYQTDDGSVWPLRLTIIKTSRGQRFLIDYPSLNCGGRWKLLRIERNRATFQEILNHGHDRCTDKGQVFLERKPGGQVVYLYSLQGSRALTASAILNRTSKARPAMP
jgi:hypothetical protein